jgi:hypothetical protein
MSSAHVRVDPLKYPTFCLHSGCSDDALHDGQGWMENASAPEFVEHGTDQKDTPGILLGDRHQPAHHVPEVPACECGQTEVTDQEGQVASPGLVAVGISLEVIGRPARLLRNEVNHRRRQFLAGSQCPSRVPDQTELNGKAQAIPGSSSLPNESQVVLAQHPVPDQILRFSR